MALEVPKPRVTTGKSFSHEKIEKNAFFSKPSHGQILISWNPILYTFLCTKIKKFTLGNFFLLMHVLVPCVCPPCPCRVKRDEAMIVGTRAILRRRRRCLVINAQWVHCVQWVLPAHFLLATHPRKDEREKELF